MNLPVYDTIEIEFNLETTKFKTHGRTFLPTARRSSENELWKSRSQWEERDEEEAETPGDRWDEGSGVVRVRWYKGREASHQRFSPVTVTASSLGLSDHYGGLFSQTAIQTIYSVFAFVFLFFFFFFSTLIVHKPIVHQRRKGASGEPRTRRNRRLFVKVNTKLEKKSTRKMLTLKEDKYN